jgi:hypothetical protein
MFVPPYEVILAALGHDKQTIRRTDTVTVPRELLETLLQIILSGSPFDEKVYVAANPDVGDAVKARQHRSGRAHFLLYGYYEGRLGGKAVVDEAWYLAENPDVAEAVRAGAIASGAEHYRSAGMFEWRAPNAASKGEIALWRNALKA